MKRLLLTLIVSVLLSTAYSQNVGIGTNTPHPSAALDITDSTKGVLIPRMTMSQRLAIQNPTEGLIVYQMDPPSGFCYFTNSTWTYLISDTTLQDFNINVRRIQTRQYLKR
jgi:hypothetical protein